MQRLRSELHGRSYHDWAPYCEGGIPGHGVDADVFIRKPVRSTGRFKGMSRLSDEIIGSQHYGSVGLSMLFEEFT